MSDFLSFRKMITPVVIQIIFWIGIVAVVIGGFVAIGTAGGDSEQVLAGILMIFLGPIAVRIYCELLIVVFRINDTLTSVYHAMAQGTQPPAAAPAAPPAAPQVLPPEQPGGQGSGYPPQA